MCVVCNNHNNDQLSICSDNSVTFEHKFHLCSNIGAELIEDDNCEGENNLFLKESNFATRLQVCWIKCTALN